MFGTSLALQETDVLFNKSTCFIKSVFFVQDPVVFIEDPPKSMKSLRLFGNDRHSF